MKNIYILPLILFIISCGEKVVEEITQRYDDGSKKTFIKIYNKDTEGEITLSKVVYNRKGDTIYCETRNKLGELDGVQMDSIWFHHTHTHLSNEYRKRYYKNNQLIKEGYSINTTTHTKSYFYVSFKDNKPYEGNYRWVDDEGQVIMTKHFSEGKRHGLQHHYHNGEDNVMYWNKGVPSDTYPYEDLLKKEN